MVGEYLRTMREEFGQTLDGQPWKQEDLAELLNVSKITVSHWEQGAHLPKQRELDHLERCRLLIELGYDPRHVRGRSLEELASEKVPAASRGFPPGRSRS